MERAAKMTAGILLGALTTLTPGFAAENPKVSWNLSTWGPPRAFTAGIEAFAKFVAAETDGNFAIKINYGEQLSKSTDNLDNIKLGAFEMAQICTGYHPGKNPAVTVLDLPGLPLSDPRVHAKVHDAVFKQPAVEAEFKRWNAFVLMSVLQPQSELMGNGEPPRKMEDFKGMRLRALGGTGEALKNLGAVPTSVPAPEVYNALERGVFRAAAFPYTYAFAAYKLDEISKWYTTNLAPGANSCPTVVNLPAYNALPAHYKELMQKGKQVAYDALIKAHDAADKKNLADWKQKGLVAITYSDEELKKFADIGAKPVWDSWVKSTAAKNVPAQQLLDFVLAEAAKAKKETAK